MNPLVVAIAVLCHFHALSSFVQGCGLLNEPTAESPPSPVDDAETENVTDIMRKMEDLMSTHVEPLDVSEVARRFETVKPDEIQTASSKQQVLKGSTANSSSRSRSPTPTTTSDEIKMVDPTKYTSMLEFQYVDFVKRDHPEQSPTFREAVSDTAQLKMSGVRASCPGAKCMSNLNCCAKLNPEVKCARTASAFTFAGGRPAGWC